ncbi:Ubiquitin carboxyl-terminal hydrolase 8 [Cichlidogyrus casuarinus]|uniref:ubiquitinyl hydrolase 1 n=1 Tax=Cichlidogyrus casuarinus TaxID=1844966 RepID=A0ABD2PZM5_9PLAT
MRFFSSDFAVHINTQNTFGGMRGEIAKEFGLVMNGLWTSGWEHLSPAKFKSQFGRFQKMFSGSDQQDSLEFLIFILDGLHEDLNTARLPGKQKPSEKKSSDQLDAENENMRNQLRAQDSWNFHKSFNESIIVELFQGQLHSTVICETCNFNSTTFDTFMYLSLPIPGKSSKCSLHDCLNEFLSKEVLIGVWMCPTCKTTRNATKRTTIWRLPPYLLIHFKRFSFTEIKNEKICTIIDFPITLDLTTKVEHKLNHSYDYSLYAVSNHSGNLDSGHYTATCKWNQEWHKFDDEVVQKISQNQIVVSSGRSA